MDIIPILATDGFAIYLSLFAIISMQARYVQLKIDRQAYEEFAKLKEQQGA